MARTLLKLDMIEQAYHVLKPHGTLVVLSPYDKEDFFRRSSRKSSARYTCRWKATTPSSGANKTAVQRPAPAA